MVKDEIVKESKQTLYNWKKNWTIKGFRKGKESERKYKKWEELKDFLLYLLDKDQFLNILKLKNIRDLWRIDQSLLFSIV